MPCYKASIGIFTVCVHVDKKQVTTGTKRSRFRWQKGATESFEDVSASIGAIQYFNVVIRAVRSFLRLQLNTKLFITRLKGLPGTEILRIFGANNPKIIGRQL